LHQLPKLSVDLKRTGYPADGDHQKKKRLPDKKRGALPLHREASMRHSCVAQQGFQRGVRMAEQDNTKRPIAISTGWCLLLICGLMQPAAADSMRCGRSLLKTGDSVSTLRSRCGEPQSRDKGYASLPRVNGGKRTSVTRWRYHLKRGALNKIVLIHEGVVVGIETGSRS
jgi:hypothetical protein